MNYKTYYSKTSRMMDQYMPFVLNAAFNNPWFEMAETEKSYKPRVDMVKQKLLLNCTLLNPV